MVVPWAIESPLGAGDGANIGGGCGKDCYGASFGELFKSPPDALLKKKRMEWSEGKKSPEVSVPVPTAFPEKQVVRERSSFLLGQDLPIDPSELDERSSRRKAASEVQKVLLEQIAERIRKRKQRREEQVSPRGNEARPEAEAKEEVEVKPEVAGTSALEPIVVLASPKRNVRMDKNKIAAEQLRKMSKNAKEMKRKQEDIKERDAKIRAELLEKKKKKEADKEAAKSFTEKFLEKGRKIMEEFEREAQINGIIKGSKNLGGSNPKISSGRLGFAFGSEAKMAGERPVSMEKNSPINFKKNKKTEKLCGLKPERPRGSVAMDEASAKKKPVLNEVAKGPFANILTVNEDHGKIPTKIPTLKTEHRKANYTSPRIRRDTGLCYERVQLDMTTTEEVPKLRLLAGVVGGNGDGVDQPSGVLSSSTQISWIRVLMPSAEFKSELRYERQYSSTIELDENMNTVRVSKQETKKWFKF